MTKFDVVIVGGGHAGAQMAQALRSGGFEGSVLVIGRENEFPYERPPLSKEYLGREKAFERLLIRPPQFWEDRNVSFLLGCSVTRIEPDAHRVMVSDGSTVSYSKLVWATGGDPRKLACPGGDLKGVFGIRNREDVDGLIRLLDAGAERIVVIGGGYIGLEAAAALTKLGCHVTLLEALPCVLARVAGTEISEFYENEHRSHGVDLRTSVAVESLEEADGKVSGVRLADGSVVEADLVIVGIGIVPAVEPLLSAGALGGNGVEVDEFCKTTLEDVYAIGDCAAFACAYAEGQVMRVESVQNANDMADCAARDICGNPQPYHALPWFWSNQYDLKLQTVGISAGYDESVVRGDPSERCFSVIYLRNGRIAALDCVNMVKDYVQGRKLVGVKADMDLEALRDASVPLKKFCELGG